jgi:Transposase
VPFKVELKVMSAMEIIGERERRRRWSVEAKLRIVGETHEPGACVRAVAARHDVYPSLLHYWRRQVRGVIVGRGSVRGPWLYLVVVPQETVSANCVIMCIVSTRAKTQPSIVEAYLCRH